MIKEHLIASIILSVILRTNGFSYKDAKNWGQKYPGCKGKHQSPIIINPSSMTKHLNNDQKLKFTNFGKFPTNMTMKNTGHTVEVKASWSGEPPTLTGGPLKGDYVFGKATFHWSDEPLNLGNDNHGPYANTDTTLMDLEMHMFFYRKDLKSFRKAETQKSGLAVFQMWFQGMYNSYTVTPIFGEIEEKLHKVQSRNSVAALSPIDLTGFLSSTLPPLDYYEGSLDYPPCSESATWFVYSYGAISAVTPNLVSEFKKIKLDKGDKSNVRPTQALNGRHVKSMEAYNSEDE